MSVSIVYGFNLTNYDFFTMFDVIKNNEEIEYIDWNYEEPVEDYIKLTDDIKYAICDFANTDEETLTIGVIIVNKKAQYNGAFEIPDINDEHKIAIDNFVKLNPKFQAIIPKMIITYGAEEYGLF